MRWAKTILVLLLLLLPLFLGKGIFAQNIEDLQQKIQEYEQELARLQQQARTLSNQIAQFDAQIRLTTTRIAQTEAEIEELGIKIGRLEVSIGALSFAFSQRAVETYKTQRLGDPLVYLLTASDLNQLLLRFHYLKLIQEHDRDLLVRLQTAQTTYEGEKEEFEALQKELEEQRAELNRQRQEKAVFLQVTRNDEKRYQELIAEAQREIQALLASQFVEKKHVNRGEVIGLMGSTGFSTGPHLHFGVYSLNEGNAASFNYYSAVEDPFSHLSARSLTFDRNACDDTPEQTVKAAGSGSWPWPMGGDIRITQCYGHTPYSFVYQGNFHHGLDLVGQGGLLVTAAEEGEAYFYRGQTSFGNNVRIFHPNGKMTLYLHLQ